MKPSEKTFPTEALRIGPSVLARRAPHALSLCARRRVAIVFSVVAALVSVMVVVRRVAGACAVVR